MVHHHYLSREEFPFLFKPPLDYDVDDDDMSTNKEKTETKEDLSDYTPKRKRRLIVVVVGGITYNELHHLRTIAKEMKQKLVIVTTSILTPQQFIKTIEEIDSS